VNALLKPVELLYRGVNRLRRGLYRRGVLRAKKLPRPVISIGNIAIGGSGKTPAVIAVARLLSDRGLRVAVLTRGYGRGSREEGVVDSLDAARWGDEPVVIKKGAPNVDVIVGVNRYQNAVDFLSRQSADVFILDDGFQHLQLGRDLDLVIDWPASWLREGRPALRDATVVMPRSIRPAGLQPLRGRRVFAFSGLADNEQFFNMLLGERIEVVGRLGFPDHHRYTPAEVAAIKDAARTDGAELIVTTEKDAVKIADPGIVVVRIDFELPDPVVQRILETVSR
jgi:tetraacyldisaccharide 4'-kinase